MIFITRLIIFNTLLFGASLNASDNFENYELINTEEVNNLDFHYYQMEKKLKLFKLDN